MVVYTRVVASGNGCQRKIVKTIQEIELIRHGEKGEEEGEFNITSRFLAWGNEQLIVPLTKIGNSEENPVSVEENNSSYLDMSNSKCLWNPSGAGGKGTARDWLWIWSPRDSVDIYFGIVSTCMVIELYQWLGEITRDSL